MEKTKSKKKIEMDHDEIERVLIDAVKLKMEKLAAINEKIRAREKELGINGEDLG